MIFEFTCTDLVRNKFFFQYDKTKLVIKKGLSKWYNLGPSLSQNLFIQPLKIKKILSGLPTRQSNTMSFYLFITAADAIMFSPLRNSFISKLQFSQYHTLFCKKGQFRCQGAFDFNYSAAEVRGRLPIGKKFSLSAGAAFAGAARLLLWWAFHASDSVGFQSHSSRSWVRILGAPQCSTATTLNWEADQDH